jgi:integrase/recombinase XerD
METLNLKDLPEEQKLLLAGLLSQLTDGAAKPKEKKVRKRKAETIKYLTEDEWDRLLKVITHPMHRAMFIVAYHRGLRASETAKLQLADVRLKDERIQITRCKGSASGEFHLCSSESRSIKSWLKVRGTLPGPLFLTRCNTGISQQMQDKLMKRYGALAGIPRDKCHIHTLKHTCATHLLARGESLEDVKDHLGHRSIKSTEGYATFTSPRWQVRDKRLREW